MKKTTKATEATKLSWIKKLKVAVAAFAFVAAGVFGASVADVPAPTEVEETAQTSYVKPLVDSNPRPFFSRWTGTWS